MLDNVNAITMAIRHMLSMFDTAVYFALEYVYQLFFNVASANVISGKIIFDLFSRVQLIIGIFMVFLLTINIIKGIINPDTFTDSKSGFGNIITRIVVSLVLLALLVPLNIRSPRNDYEKRINNSGILFGTLYSLQDRILKQDTIGKLIFGNSNNNYTSDDENSQEKIYTFSRRFSSAVLKSFYVLNVDDEGKSICEDGEGYDNIYAEDALSPVTITSMATLTCTVSEENENHTYGLIDLLSPAIAQISHQVADVLDQSYVISIIPLLPTIAGIALAILMFMITFDVAVRVFKLAALQLLAPIPIISYMDPKGGKDTAFNTWVKLLTSTYLDLFIHLGVIYFAISIVSALMKQLPAIVISNASNTGSTATTIALLRPTFVILCIGLFIFAKEAPKFLKEMLGIKSDKKFFGAFGEALGVGAIAHGTVIGGISNAKGKYEANSDKSKSQRNLFALGGAITGAASGGYNAGKLWMKNKDASTIVGVNEKLAKRNYARAADGSTIGGRLLAGFQSSAGLKNKFQQMQDKIKYYEAADAALSRVNKAFDSNGDCKIKFDQKFATKLAQKGADKGLTYRFNNGNLIDREGNVILKADHEYSLKDFNDMISRVSSFSDADMKDAVDEAKKQAQDMRFKQIRSKSRDKLVELVNDANEKEWTENDLIAYDALHTIFEVATKYSDDAVFVNLKGKQFDDPNISWGQYKGAASGAGRKGDQIKHSDEYAQEESNAKRAEEAKNS